MSCGTSRRDLNLCIQLLQLVEGLEFFLNQFKFFNLSIQIAGIHEFDFMLLGYRVDWPVSIVVTQDALKIYAEIFGYLVQVRLAVFSLTDVGCCLKVIISNLSFCPSSHYANRCNYYPTVESR